jgi:hypothetical protein
MKDFKINANVNGKTWLTRNTTLKANNEAEAIERAKVILRLTEEHEIKVTPCKVHKVSEVLKTIDYPYGRERATAFFSVEMNNKGCRTVFQTINPKTGRLNNPKKGNYYQVILPIELENNYFEFTGYLDFNGTEAITKGLYFMNDYKDCFSLEQLKSIAVFISGMMKINAKSQVIYCGSKWEDLKPYYENPLHNIIKIATGENTDFLSCLLDFDAIESLKVPNFQPFKVVQYG